MSLAQYIEEPITQPTPVVRLGKHGPWEPLAFKLVGDGYHAQAAAVVTKHHVVRTPVYYCRIARYAPSGTWRVLHGSWRWFTDADGRKALRNTFDREGESFRLARTQHREEIKARCFVSVAGLAVAGLGGIPLCNPSVRVNFGQMIFHRPRSELGPSFIRGVGAFARCSRQTAGRLSKFGHRTRPGDVGRADSWPRAPAAQPPLVGSVRFEQPFGPAGLRSDEPGSNVQRRGSGVTVAHRRHTAWRASAHSLQTLPG